MKRRKRLWMAAAGTALFLAAGYLGGSLYFMGHYAFRTVIGGVDVGCRTPEEAEALLRREEEEYVLELAGREELKDSILPGEVGLSIRHEDVLGRIKEEQNGFLWPLSLFAPSSCEIARTVEYSGELLEKRVRELVFFAPDRVKEPEDARIGEYDPRTGRYALVQEKMGAKLDFSRTVRAASEALERLDESLDLDEEGCYLTPDVTAEDFSLNRALNRVNRYVGAVITYDWNGSRELVDSSLISQWIEVEGNRAVLDQEKIREYVDSMAEAHDTYGKPHIFTATDGRRLEIKGGFYGWKTDREAEAKKLEKDIRVGVVASREPVYSVRAAAGGEDDIGDSYVEIDLGAQHLYVYAEGHLVLQSDFVSGNVARGDATPAGVFGLTYKTRNAVLKGEGYATPVSYWMPFNGNIGMHDASWRAQFGGEIYLTAGSHGCINLPPQKAKEIYEYMYTGYPIICYD